MSDRGSILHREVIEFFRAEVDRRYRMEYLQEVPKLHENGLLEGVAEDTVARAKLFFKEVLYPVGDERRLRDESVEEVLDILGDQGRIMSLLPKMPGFLLRYGSSLVTAARAGLEVLSTFRFSTEIENQAVEHLEELCDEEGIEVETESAPGAESGGRVIPEELLRRAFALVPPRRVEKMMAHLRKLTRLGMHRGTVAATQEVLSAIREGVETAHEEEAIDYALWVLERLDEEVEAHRRPLMERLVKITEYVERYYLEELAVYAPE